MSRQSEKVFLKKVYTHREGYTALYKGMRTVKYLVLNRMKKHLSKSFVERIMLAVTEVNGCEVCAYGHTKLALESGMSNEEIQQMLSGSTDRIPGDELQAILFAQHYADSRGKPSMDAWNRIFEIYGNEKAHIILSAIRTIMVGNIFGIPLSAVIRRFKFKKVYKTNIFYEITMLLCVSVFFPVAVIHAMASSVLKVPMIESSE